MTRSMPQSAMTGGFVLVLVLGWTVLFTNPVSAQTAYTISQILTSSGGGQVPRRLNNIGDFVGRAVNPTGGGTNAATWRHGTLQSNHLGALPGGDYSSGFSINDAGQVAGASNTASALVPFFWNATSGLQRIPLLRGDNCGQAVSINKYGHVAGYSSGPNGPRGFLWAQASGIRNLGCLPGGNSSRANAVNDSDEVAGTSGSPSGDRAVVWTSIGNIRDLGTLAGDTSSEATAINNAGEVVGYSKGPRGLRAFLWSPGTGMQSLGVLAGGNSSRATDVNDSGVVVGSSATSSGDHAFVWTTQTGMADLNSAASADLGIVLVEANAINSGGTILVLGKANMNRDLEEHDCAAAPPAAFLLKPVANPVTPQPVRRIDRL